MKVFVTGVAGFLGRHLASAAAGEGVEVAGSVSSRERLAALPPEVGEAHLLALGEPVEPAWFAGADAVVHLAHDMRAGEGEATRSGTRRLLAAAAAAGVGNQIFASSYSAGTAASSEYARVKRELEADFLNSGHTVVRPGLVVGRGGLYERISRVVAASPVVPLVGGGRNPVAVVGLRDLLTSLVALIVASRPGLHRLHHPELVELGALLRATARARGLRRLFVPVPLPLAFAGVALLRLLRLPAALDPDNLRGLAASRERHATSDLASFVPHPRSLEEMVHDCWREAGP